MTGAAHDDVANYSGLRLLGRGSLGEVFEAFSARDEGFEERVVLKLVAPELAAEAGFLDELRSAAQRAMRLSHPNVVQVLDVGHDDRAGLYVALEHVAGASLARVLELIARADQACSPGLALYLAAEIAKALDHAHSRRDAQGGAPVLHGDLGASNVFLTWHGEVKVGDFCLCDPLFAAQPQALRAGKWSSISPERARGEAVTPASDLFALGSMLFELLSGENPFERPGAEQSLRALANLTEPPELRADDVPAELAQLVHSLLEPDATRRPKSAAAVYERLMAINYASGSRFGAAELSELLARDARPPVPSAPRLRGLMQSLHEGSAPELEVRYESLERHDSLPPNWSSDSDFRETTLALFAALQPPSSEAVEVIGATLRRYGARILEIGQREVVAIFGLVDADGRSAENAARCALTILRTFQRSALMLSCGIAGTRLKISKDAEPADEDNLQRSVGRARELAGRRGWVVADRQSARQLRRLFELEPLGQDAYAWVVEDARSEPLGQFVGRRQLLRQLGEAIKRAHRGRLQVMGLRGVPGIGKSRLLNEFARRLAADDQRVASALATCPPHGRSVPLSAADAILRALCGVREGDALDRILSVEPRLRSLGLSEHQVNSALVQLGAFASSRALPALAPLGPVLRQLFSSLARDRVYLFAWDNAQELDQASAELLAELCGSLADSRIMLLFVARSDEHAPYAGLPSYTELEVGELDKRDARRLIMRRLDVDRIPDRVFSHFHERAAGHPMLLEELVLEAVDSGQIVVKHRYLESAELKAPSLPPSLRSMLSDRLRRLPHDQKNLLVGAAVLGAPVDSAVLAQMGDISVGVVNALAEALEEQEILRRDSFVTLAFNSPLMPEVILADLAPEQLRELNRQAARAYQAVFGDGAESARQVAEHLEKGGEPARAAAHFAKLGLSNMHGGRFDRAVADLSRALQCCDFHAVQAGDLALWIPALAQAVELAHEGRNLVELASRVQQGLARVKKLAAPIKSQLLLSLGSILAHSDHFAEARKLMTHSMELAKDAPDLYRSALTRASEIALRRGEFAQALELSARAEAAAPGSARERHRNLITLAQALASVDRGEEALAAVDQAQQLVPDTDTSLACARNRTRAIIHAFRGDWQACAAASEEAAQQGRAAGLNREVAANLYNLGEALIRTGDNARAFAALHASLAVAEEASLERIANFDRILLAYLDALDGLPGADELMAAGITQAERRGWTLDQLTGRYFHGKLLAARSEFDAARDEFSSVRQVAMRVENRPLARDCALELEFIEPTIVRSEP